MWIIPSGSQDILLSQCLLHPLSQRLLALQLPSSLGSFACPSVEAAGALTLFYIPAVILSAFRD